MLKKTDIFILSGLGLGVLILIVTFVVSFSKIADMGRKLTRANSGSNIEVFSAACQKGFQGRFWFDNKAFCDCFARGVLGHMSEMDLVKRGIAHGLFPDGQVPEKYKRIYIQNALTCRDIMIQTEIRAAGIASISNIGEMDDKYLVKIGTKICMAKFDNQKLCDCIGMESVRQMADIKRGGEYSDAEIPGEYYKRLTGISDACQQFLEKPAE